MTTRSSASSPPPDAAGFRAARFTRDGHALDAPAGTLVAVDPHVHREAVATESDTAVLALGGPPTFQPAGHEYMARVRGALDRPADALKIAETGLEELSDSPGARAGSEPRGPERPAAG